MARSQAVSTAQAGSSPFYAGKNKIINGDFRINQRGFSSTTSNDTYGHDRWVTVINDGTTTYSTQTFTAGTAPVAGYEGINYARIVSSGQTSTGAYSILAQRMEDVRLFAGQTATVSFWAKASSGTPSVAVNLAQYFGSGGSSTVYNLPTTTKVAITTSWARYSFVTSVASISGKTIGAGNYLRLDIYTSAGSNLNSFTNSLGIQSATIDIWGVQVEAGSVATAFQTATGTLQGELAACQRYFWKQTGGHNTIYGIGSGGGTTAIYPQVPLPVPLRTKTPVLGWSNLRFTDFGAAVTPSAIVIYTTTGGGGSVATNHLIQLDATVTGATAYRPYHLQNADNTAGYLQFDAEL
jgi:hypothetical protein